MLFLLNLRGATNISYCFLKYVNATHFARQLHWSSVKYVEKLRIQNSLVTKTTGIFFNLLFYSSNYQHKLFQGDEDCVKIQSYLLFMKIYYSTYTFCRNSV